MKNSGSSRYKPVFCHLLLSQLRSSLAFVTVLFLLLIFAASFLPLCHITMILASERVQLVWVVLLYYV